MSGASQPYGELLARLYGLAPRGIVLGLGPIASALASWGDPQAGIPAVHVAGTNGKGSVSAMLDAMLRASGRRVGLYTSPHLHHFAERIRIDGVPVATTPLRDTLARVLREMDAGRLPALTFFEATTLAAWTLFAEARVEVAVLEVGLGGRLDATNVCVPAVTAITRIARDHEALLGTTLTEIAREKAGILKPGVPCVLGPDLREGEAREAIAATAHRVRAPLFDAPRVRATGVQGGHTQMVLERAQAPASYDVALGGGYQAGNVAVAIGTAERLGVTERAIRAGLGSVQWPGRFERIGNVLFDVAHNPDGVEALARAIEALEVPRPQRALVFGASRDKDWREMLATLTPRFTATHRFFAAAGLRRAEEPARLAAQSGGGAACASVADAMARARNAVGEEGLIVVCGSIFLVGDARAELLGVVADPPIGM